MYNIMMIGRQRECPVERADEAQTPISGNAIAYLFQFKVLFCLLHAGNALTHLH